MGVKIPIPPFMKIKPLIISLLLILGVVAILPDQTLNLRCNRQLLAAWIAMIAFALFFLKNPWLRWFLVWMVLRVIWSFVLKDTGGEFYITLNTIFIFLISYQFLMNEVRKEHIVHLLNAICIITLLHLLWMGMQFFGLWVFVIPLNATGGKIFLKDWPLYILITPMKYTITGLMGNPNTVSALLALGLPAFFRKRWCWAIPLIWMGLVSSHSNGGTIPAGLATLWLVWNTTGRHKYWILSGLGITGIIYLLKKGDFIADIWGVRPRMWWAVFRDVISKHWIIGWGIGKFKIATTHPNQKICIYGMLHNEWLELWFEQGIIGFGLVMGFMISAVKRYWFTINKSWISRIAFIGVLTVMFNGSVNFLFHVSPGIMAIVWFVILEKSLKKEERNYAG